MKLELELELTDVYGGDGNVRMIEVQETKVSRTKSSQRTKKEIGVPVESAVDEVKSEKSSRKVETFRMDEEGRPTLRIGGVHGKLWGALKDASEQLSAIGDPAFDSMASARRILNTVFVTPVIVPLEVEGGMRTETMAQGLNGGYGKGMIFPIFDVIPKAKATVTVEFPDSVEAKVRKLLERTQGMGLFNKRRTTLKIVSVS